MAKLQGKNILFSWTFPPRLTGQIAIGRLWTFVSLESRLDERLSDPRPDDVVLRTLDNQVVVACHRDVACTLSVELKLDSRLVDADLEIPEDAARRA
jgi:hypothetical protein